MLSQNSLSVLVTILSFLNICGIVTSTIADMVDQKLLKFLHKLITNKLPAYFNLYKPYLKRINTTYNLRRNPLPVPTVKHKYAESLLIYRLVKLKNTMSVKFPPVAKKLDEGSHSLASFSNYVAKNYDRQI